jgi:imidazolonepropionase-like amidohydrolase
MRSQQLNQEAAKAMTAGRRAGVVVEREAALAWVTLNAAWVLGIGSATGSLEPGKMADIVLWSADPFSVYSRADSVYIDGRLVYDKAHRPHRPSDFELGQGAAVQPTAVQPTAVQASGERSAP